MEIWKTQKKVRLTKKMVENAEPNSIIVSGYGYIEHPWFNDAVGNLESDGRSVLVKWVAVRGYIADWAIYHSLDASFVQEPYLDSKDHLDVSFYNVAKHGQKLYWEDLICGLVDCDEEVLKMYRF